MGVTDSRVVIETLSAACREAEETEKDNIENLLTKREFINLLRHLWTQIPVGTRRSIGRPTYHDPRTRSRKRLKKKHSSKISISETLRANVLRWKERPLLFFTEDGSTLDLDDLPLAQSYKYLTKVHERRESDAIRSRFLKVMYYRLKTRLCIDQMRSNNVDKVANIILESGLVNTDLETVTRKVTGWTNEGRRIDALCQDIGCVQAKNDTYLGNIFCFPGDVHDEFIRTIPLSGPVREDEIRSLKTRGILDVEGKENLNDLANALFGKLWEKIEDSITRTTHFTGTGEDWALQRTQCFRIQDAGNFSRQGTEETTCPGTRHESREDRYSSLVPRADSAAPISSNPISSFHMAVNNLAAYLPTRRDGDETTRECSEFSAEEIATSMTQSGSVVAVANNTLARMGSRLNMHANAEPIPQEPMDAIDEQTIAWMGSTLNMHANAEPIPQEPMDTIDEQTIAWMGSTLNMHANAETMPQEPMDAIDEQAVAWMGSTLNMHANAEPIPQISRDVLQNRDTLGSHGAIASLEVEHRDPESHIPNETSNNSSQYHWSVPRQQTHWDVVVK